MRSIPTTSHDAAFGAFTTTRPGARPTFALVLVSVAVAALAMALDDVPRYSETAFGAGIGLTVVLAVVVGIVIERAKGSSWPLAVLLPTAGGAIVGAVVQAAVLGDVGETLHDLGGLVDTAHPVSWVLSGVLLGGAPALVVAAFLGLARRTMRRLTGHDAQESFGVAYSGGAGLLAAFGLVLVEGVVVPPLLAVMASAALSLVVTVLVDGSRIRFLRQVYAGTAGFDVMPSERAARDPSLRPMVSNSGATSVLLRVAPRIDSYRGAAAEPVALVAAREDSALRPLVRRRIAATAIVLAMCVLAGLAGLGHA